MSNNLYAADGWIRTRLGTDTLLTDPTNPDYYCTNFYSEAAGDNASGRYIVWIWQGGPTVLNGSIYIASEPLFVVKAIGKTSRFEDLQKAADRIDFLLHNSSGIYQDRSIRQVVKEDEYRLTEVTGDVQYRHLGGYYRFYIQ